jgi:hypothetical protein
MKDFLLRIGVWRLLRRVKPGKEIPAGLHYVSLYTGDPNNGKLLKVLRHVYVMEDPDMGWRPCYEVQLPNGKKTFYLDPEVSRFGKVFIKNEAGGK